MKLTLSVWKKKVWVFLLYDYSTVRNSSYHDTFHSISIYILAIFPETAHAETVNEVGLKISVAFLDYITLFLLSGIPENYLLIMGFPKDLIYHHHHH